MRKESLLLFLVSAVSAACGGAEDKVAIADIQPTTGKTATGTGTFTLTDGHVYLDVQITNAPPGTYGIHIHQNGACTNDAADAGLHWNGSMEGPPEFHGLPTSGIHHLGDLGNITIGADGSGNVMGHSHLWTMGDGKPTDVLNHSVVLHVAMDDGTMASSGAAQACGVVVAR